MLQSKAMDNKYTQLQGSPQTGHRAMDIYIQAVPRAINTDRTHCRATNQDKTQFTSIDTHRQTSTVVAHS